MYRSKKIILLSHCMLNYNSKVENTNAETSVVKEIVRNLLDANIGIIQLPCPELCHLGIKRWGHSREQLNTPYFRKRCRNLLEPVIEQLTDYYLNGYKLLGLIGINGSPSCGVDFSFSGNWGGEFADISGVEKQINASGLCDSKGVFIEEIEKMLRAHNITFPIIGVDECDRAFSIEKLNKLTQATS